MINNDTQPRPVGVKESQTARELAKRNAAVAHGSDGIQVLAEVSRKRNKISEQLVEVERESALMKLFLTEGTDPETRKCFLEVTQARVNAELEKTTATAIQCPVIRPNLRICSGLTYDSEKNSSSTADNESINVVSTTTLMSSDE